MIKFSNIMIELSNVCNFSCSFCPSDNLIRKRYFMPYDLVLKIIDEVKERKYADTVYLHVMGEPTIHPRFCDIIKYIDNKGMKVSLVTNGSMLAGEIADTILQLSNPDIVISIQEDDPEAYLQRTRGLLTFSDYKNRIEAFVKQALSLNRSARIQIEYLTYITRIGSFAFANLLSEHRRFRRIWNEWQERLHLSKRRFFHLFDLNRSLPLTGKITLHPRYKARWSNQMLGPNEIIIPNDHGRCEFFNNNFVILADGTCTFCCVDYEGRMNLGNINHSSFEDIYNSAKVRHLKNGNDNGKMIHELCRTCKGKIMDINTKRIVKKRNFISEYFMFMCFIRNHGPGKTIQRILNRFK